MTARASPAFVVFVVKMPGCNEPPGNQCCLSCFSSRSEQIEVVEFFSLLLLLLPLFSASLAPRMKLLRPAMALRLPLQTCELDMVGRSPELLKRMREPGSPSGERMAADIMLRRLVANKARDEGLSWPARTF